MTALERADLALSRANEKADRLRDRIASYDGFGPDPFQLAEQLARVEQQIDRCYERFAEAQAREAGS